MLACEMEGGLVRERVMHLAPLYSVCVEHAEALRAFPTPDVSNASGLWGQQIHFKSGLEIRLSLRLDIGIFRDLGPYFLGLEKDLDSKLILSPMVRVALRIYKILKLLIILEKKKSVAHLFRCQTTNQKLHSYSNVIR